MKFAMIFAILIVFAGHVFAYPYYTGYSGSPSRRACSYSCHHIRTYAPTISISGFPESYEPGQQYTLAVGHSGGGAISNFNCSIRIGSGSSNAGVITSGTNTSTYSTSGETNGVHFTSSNMNTGTFLWTAPSAGTGTVRLYLAGLQGNFSGGADTQIVSISSETQTGIEDSPVAPGNYTLAQNYPNPFNSETMIEFTISKSGRIVFEIDNILGQQVFKLSRQIDVPGAYSINWNGKDGDDMPSGIYFYRLQTDDGFLIRKMTLLR